MMTSSFRQRNQSIPLLAVGLSAAAMLLPACGLREDDAFRNSVPTSDTVDMKVPGATGTSQGALSAEGTASVGSPLLGEQADYYKLTRAVTGLVNGATYTVLALVRTIVAFPATHVAKDMAVWGPYTDPLSPNTWRLTVNRSAPHVYDYVLEARAKTADDSAFIAILTGHHAAVVDVHGDQVEGLGNGNFSVDWDAAQTLPEHDRTVGKAAFTYARPTWTDTVTIDVDFTGIKDQDNAEIYDAKYRYAATPGAGGDFQYAANRDVYPGPGLTNTAKELLTIHSRWQETGAGRSDAQVNGGDVPATLVATVNECWDQNFASTFHNVSYDPTQNWGQETSCVFATAAYSSLN
jgi:hypothetical protein